jgi:hypothetical protein
MKNPVLVIAVLVLAASLSLQAQHRKDSAQVKEKKYASQTATAGKFEIPGSLKAEHEELHKNLET